MVSLPHKLLGSDVLPMFLNRWLWHMTPKGPICCHLQCSNSVGRVGVV